MIWFKENILNKWTKEEERDNKCPQNQYYTPVNKKKKTREIWNDNYSNQYTYIVEMPWILNWILIFKQIAIVIKIPDLKLKISLVSAD